MQCSRPETHMFHSARYGDPELPHLPVDLQPQTLMLHSHVGGEPPHLMPIQTGWHFSPNEVRIDCKKSCHNSVGNASDYSTILCQKDVMPFPNSSHPMAVWIMDCRCKDR